jgi:hypothetical protein
MLDFKQFIKEAYAKGGFDYEDHVNNTLQKHSLQPKGQKSAGSSGSDADGTIHASGKHHNLEIKKDKDAMMGQVELHHDGKKWHVSANAKKNNPATAAHVEKHFLPHVNKHWGKPSGDYHTDLKMGNVYHTVKGTQPIRDHYGKDRKTPYMQIGGSGLHHTSSDKGKIGTKPLNGNTQFRARFKARGTDKATGKRKYGALVVLSLKDHQPTHVDLDKHAKDIAKTHKI